MLENYEKLAKLGDGAQGSVYKVRHRTTKKELALKMIRCRDTAQANLALKEVKVLIQLRHPAIVTYSDFFLDFDSRNPKEMLVCLVMELCEERHFEQLIKATKGAMMLSGRHPIPEDTVLSWIEQAAHALAYIHEKGFMHRDLKPSNIFFASEGEGGSALKKGGGEGTNQQQYATTRLGGIVPADGGGAASSSGASSSSASFQYPKQLKLGDFGLATAAQPNGDLNKSAVGTPYYCAPEQMLRQKYDNKVDIWGLGAVALELVCLRDRPINSEVLERPEIVETIVGDVRRMGFSAGLGAIIRDMISRHPAARPTAAVVVDRVRSLRAHQRGGAGASASAASSRVASAAASRNASHNNSGIEEGTAKGSIPALSTPVTPYAAAIDVASDDPFAVLAALEAGRQCELCEARPAAVLCRECREAMCGPCDAEHHRLTARATHRRTAIEPASPILLVAADGANNNANSNSSSVTRRHLALLAAAGAVPCQMCEGAAAVVLCPSCEHEAYCKACDELRHINPKRRLHERLIIATGAGGNTNATGANANGGGYCASSSTASAPSSRRGSPKADPLAATLAGGMVIGGSLGGSIINSTTILPPPQQHQQRRAAPYAGQGGMAPPPEPNASVRTPTAEPLCAIPFHHQQTQQALERQRSAGSLAASTIQMGASSLDATTITTAPAALAATARSSSSSRGADVQNVGSSSAEHIATLRNNGKFPHARSTNPHLMPRQELPPRPCGIGAPVHAAFIDKHIGPKGGGGVAPMSSPGGSVPPLSVRVPSAECPTMADALAAIGAAVEQRRLAAARQNSSGNGGGALPIAPSLRNDRIVVVADVTVAAPLTISFPVDIIGLPSATNGAASSSSPVGVDAPSILFNCTPAFTLTGTTATTASGPQAPVNNSNGSAPLLFGTLSNLNIRHDCAEIPPSVNRARVAAVVVEGSGQWRLERCRLSSAVGHGLIAEGPDACARVADCAVVGTRLCGVMLLNGTGGEVTGTHIIDAKQTGILVRRGVTTRICKNQIRQNGETGVYIVDATPIVEENDVSANSGCGFVVKGEEAAPTIRDNTIANNTQAGVFYCDAAKGTICDNIVSENHRAGILIKTAANPNVTRNIVRRSRETGIYCFEGGRGTITHNTITDNQNAGILVTTGAKVVVANNRIHKNYYEALWVCKKGEGSFQNNDLRGNRKGPKDIEEGSFVVLAGNIES